MRHTGMDAAVILRRAKKRREAKDACVVDTPICLSDSRWGPFFSPHLQYKKSRAEP